MDIEALLFSLSAALFFSLLPKDVLRMIAALVRQNQQRRRGTVRDVRAIEYKRPFFPRDKSVGAQRMCFDRSGNLVVPFYFTDEVCVFDRTGAFAYKIGCPRQHDKPRFCVMDSRDRLFVVEEGRRCISVFTVAGGLLHDATAEEMRNAYTIELSNDETTLYVLTCPGNDIHMFDTATRRLLPRRIFLSGMPYASALAALSTGHLAVVLAEYRSCVAIYDPATGAQLRSFGISLREIAFDCQLAEHQDCIAVDAADNLYLCCRKPGHIAVISTTAPDGCELVGHFNGQASRSGALRDPGAVAIDHDGNIAVAEKYSHTTYLYKSA